MGSAVAEAAREAARALHRAGKLDQARLEYQRLLASAPEDAELLGLLGVVAFQQVRTDEAEELLRRALRALNADPRIHLQNLNNLFILLKDQGREDAARALAGSDLPDWPPNALPNAAQRTTVLSLCVELANCGHPDRALSLLDSVLSYLGDDAEALYLAGRLRLKCDDPKAALSDLQRAREYDPGNWQTLAALSTAHDVLGHRAAAREAAERIARAAPVYVAPRCEEQQATILVLNRMPRGAVSADHGLHGVHFTRNYISQISRLMAKEFRFASVFADLPDPLPKLPSADLVFHNIASAEQMNLPGQLDQVMELVERIDRPVINHPRAVLQMTRQKAADLLQGITGLRVPRIARYRRDIARFDEIKSDIASRFTYPVIVRHLAADQSSKSLLSENKTAILVNDADELETFLKGVRWPEFYVIQYVNLRKADGNFRKLRAAFFPDEIIIIACGYYSEWMVAGWRNNQEGHAFYDAFPKRVIDMQRTLRDPEALLGAQFMPVLQAIRKRVPLEVFGMDFDLDDDGQVVLFEATATMLLLLPRADVPDHLQLPRELDDRVNGAFRRLVRRKIAAEG